MWLTTLLLWIFCYSVTFVYFVENIASHMMTCPPRMDPGLLCKAVCQARRKHLKLMVTLLWGRFIALFWNTEWTSKDDNGTELRLTGAEQMYLALEILPGIYVSRTTEEIPFTYRWNFTDKLWLPWQMSAASVWEIANALIWSLVKLQRTKFCHL